MIPRASPGTHPYLALEFELFQDLDGDLRDVAHTRKLEEMVPWRRGPPVGFASISEVIGEARRCYHVIHLEHLEARVADDPAPVE